MCEYAEMHWRALRLLDLADWDDVVLDQLQVDWLRIRQLGTSVSIESVNHASTVYRANIETGELSHWNAGLLPAALDALRRHMVLDDLADV